MPLHFVQPPKEALDIFSSWLEKSAKLFGKHAHGNPLGGAFSPDRIEMPMEIFSLTLAEIRAGAGLPDASPEGWRVFLQEGPPWRVSEVIQGRDGLVFMGLSVGPQIDFLHSLLAQVGEEGDFTARFFRVMPLNLAALWLASGDAEKDALISLPPSRAPFEAGRRYNTVDFSQYLRRAAESKRPNAEIFFRKEMK